MIQVEVKKTFRDKNTGTRHEKGHTVSYSEGRAKELERVGVVKIDEDGGGSTDPKKPGQDG